MQQSFLCLVPTLLTIVLVFLTRNVVLSLLCGVATAAFIVSHFSLAGGLVLAAKKVFMVLELGNLTSFHGFLQSEKLLLFLFLLVLGVVIATIAESGEGYGYVERLSQRLRSRSQAQLATIFLSFSLFIDDYLNALTTSSVMKNLTDKFRIPRLKLAFLTTAMAAPLCSLVPISSWAAAIIMFLLEAGISTSTESAIILADPFVTFSKSIPFIFFSLFLILGALFIVLGKISYGVMAEEEKKAASPEASVLGALHNPVSELPTVDYSKLLATHSTFNFFSPLLILSGAIFVAMLATGGYFSQGARLVPSLVAAKAELSLLLGALVGLGYTMLLFFLRAKINLHEALRAVKDGVMMMKDSLLVLALAWVLASFMRQDLGTGKYLAQFLMPFVSGEFLPVSVFLMSGAVAFSIGSAWATMAVIFPMVIPMVAEFAGITTPVAIDLVGSIYPVIGAVISGAIFGSSLSPIADLLVITSKNTKVDHFEYVKAQMQYLLPVGVGSALAFALVGVFGSSFSYFSSFLISVIPGFLATACLMLFLSFLNKA